MISAWRVFLALPSESRLSIFLSTYSPFSNTHFQQEELPSCILMTWSGECAHCLFSWIPVLNIVFMVICKAIIFLLDKPFYICILPDIKKYLAAVTNEPIYEVVEEDQFQAETPAQDEDQ